MGDETQIDKSAFSKCISVCNANVDILHAGTQVNVKPLVPTDMASVVGNNNYLLNLDSIIGNSD